MYCKSCGEFCNDGATFCTKCGQKLNETDHSIPVYEAPPVYTAEETKTPGKGLGIASLILGICSVVCCYVNFPCAVLSIIFGIISNKKAKKGTATAGIVLSSITIALTVIGVLAYILIYVIYGVALFSSASSVSGPSLYY